jgi:hypothetical protein
MVLGSKAHLVFGRTGAACESSSNVNEMSGMRGMIGSPVEKSPRRPSGK